MKLFSIGVISLLITMSCAEGNFAGDSGKIFRKASDGNCKPTPTKPCIGSPGTSGSPNGGGNPLESDDGGRALLSQAFASFYFSGNGPGSCANSQACGTGAPQCEAGSEDAGAGIVGDCTNTPNNRCFGNRRICRAKGKLAGDRVATDFHFYVNSDCPAGWEGAGPIAGQNHHKVGYLLGDAWGYYSFCRRTIPMSEVVSKSTQIITDVRILNAGMHVDANVACPSGYQEAGVITDCVNSPNNLLPNGVTCKGVVTVCKQFKLVP
jgi:hypothetical protein